MLVFKKHALLFPSEGGMFVEGSDGVYLIAFVYRTGVPVIRAPADLSRAAVRPLLPSSPSRQSLPLCPPVPPPDASKAPPLETLGPFLPHLLRHLLRFSAHKPSAACPSVHFCLPSRVTWMQASVMVNLDSCCSQRSHVF